MEEEEEEEILEPAASGQASSKRRAYTSKEDEKILRYLTINKEFGRVGSATLWQKMEEEEVVEGRSCMSMRERYRRIMRNVKPSSLEGKTEEEILTMADSGRASSRRWDYTTDEDERILRYVTNNNISYLLVTKRVYPEHRPSGSVQDSQEYQP